ncbi:hypothetical protein [Roseovarius sp. D22-M7]|uniref:hypothetical protein n=1 Tax=Roseovarius sp. D22-M7 TaxID=3127116 RepID=UPI00300F87CC
MNIQTNQARILLRCAQLAAAFEAWLREEGDSLIAAADLLGGSTWKTRADNVVTAITHGASAIEVLDDLKLLRRLLELEYLDDPFCEEANRFAMVHPDDARADEARICAEALETGIKALGAIARAGFGSHEEVV